MAVTVKLDGDPEGGWIGEVHDGQTHTSHSPEGGSQHQALLDMIRRHWGEAESGDSDGAQQGKSKGKSAAKSAD